MRQDVKKKVKIDKRELMGGKRVSFRKKKLRREWKVIIQY